MSGDVKAEGCCGVTSYSCESEDSMPVFAYIDPGTTGLIAQFAAAGFAGVLLYFRSRFGKQETQEDPIPQPDEATDERA